MSNPLQSPLMNGSAPAIKYPYPQEPRLNENGQWTHIRRAGFDWYIHNANTHQSNLLEIEDLAYALGVVLFPLMS